MSIPPQEFFHIFHPGGRALVYPRAFDGPVVFTPKHCQFLSMRSSSTTTKSLWWTTSKEDKNEMVDPQNGYWNDIEQQLSFFAAPEEG